MERFGAGISGPFGLSVPPLVYIMSSCSLARHVHFGVLHVQFNVHGGMVCVVLRGVYFYVNIGECVVSCVYT